MAQSWIYISERHGEKTKTVQRSPTTIWHITRDTQKPGTQILYNFGRADQIDRQQLVRLCHSIARVCELTIEDSTSPLEQSQQQKKWVEDLKLVRSRELGTVAVIEALWERLGIGGTLRRIVQKAGCLVPF